jgi:DnaJ domain
LPLLVGILALALLVWLGKSYVKADPTLLARYGRRTGGVLAFGVAILLLLKGRIDAALLLAAIGGWLYGVRLPFQPWYWSTGQGPTVERRRTRAVETYPDLKGQMDGRFLEGPFAGRGFSSLSEEEQKQAAADLAARDPEGLSLFQAYLHGRATGWRETVEDDAGARQSAQGRAGTMSEKEAYEVLGLQMGAGEEEIRQAHRSLMKKLHPDQGGSTYLATRVNMAKDVLLRTHR